MKYDLQQHQCLTKTERNEEDKKSCFVRVALQSTFNVGDICLHVFLLRILERNSENVYMQTYNIFMRVFFYYLRYLGKHSNC